MEPPTGVDIDGSDGSVLWGHRCGDLVILVSLVSDVLCGTVRHLGSGIVGTVNARATTL